MRVAEIPITIWTQFANRNDGADWRLATRKVALWYKPMYPRQHADVPNREAELTKLFKKRTAHPDKSFTAAVRRADDWIKAQTSDASDLRMTMHQYHCTPYPIDPISQKN